MLGAISLPHPYTLVGTLGAGGMAAVYLVRDQDRGTLHALKVAHVATESGHLRLLREASLHARLAHPNVVAINGVVDLGRGVPALLMEYVPGPSLADLLAATTLTVEEVDALARPLLRGLAAAHEAGLVHRDLKPSNVLLGRDERGLIPKIADFGIAKELTPASLATLTNTGSLLGTPQYMSPEQLDDAKRVDARSDVFAMGAMLYEMVTGRAAFEAAGPMQVLERIRKGDFTPLGERAPGLPARMERAITRALANAPEDRHADGGALLTAWTGDDAPDLEEAWPPRLLARVDALRANVGAVDETIDGERGAWLNTAAPSTPRATSSPRSGAALWAWAAALVVVIAVVAVVAIAPWRDAAGDPSGAAVRAPDEAVFLRLTFNEAEDQVLGAALSPDGTRLVTTERAGAYLRASLPGPAVALQLPPDREPIGAVAWCGDDAIAISLRAPEAPASADVWLGTPPAGPWRLVLAGAAVRACSWDGTRLVAVTATHVNSVGLPDGEVRPIAPIPEGAYVAQAALSPDAARLAYTLTKGDESQVLLVDSRGTSPPTLMRDDALPHGLAWSGDGKLLTLRVRDKEHDDRWASILSQRISEDGAVVDERVLVPRIGPAAETFSVSRAGDRLTFLTIARQRSLFIGMADGSDVRQLTRDRAPAFASAWQDDETVVYSAAVDGSLDVLVRPLGAPAPTKVRGGPADEYGATPVPGTRDWLVERRAPGGDDVELVWARPDGEAVVWSGRGADYLARRRTRCVPGPACFFGVIDAAGVAVSRVTPNGMEPASHLPTEPWRPVGWDVSPDAQRIVWSSSRGLEIGHLDGSSARTIALDGAVQEVVWGPAGDRVYATVMGLGAHAYAIIRVELDDAAVTVLHADSGWLSHLALSPSGTRLAWTRTQYDVVVWLADLGHGPP